VLRGPGLADGSGEQVLDLVDGERDQAGVGWGHLVRGCRGRCLGVGDLSFINLAFSPGGRAARRIWRGCAGY
jgi:hypothetical protein